MVENGLRRRPVLAEQDGMETGPTHTLLDAADSGKERDDGTFLRHAQMVPQECLAQVAFKSHSRVILQATSSVRPTSTRSRHRLDDPSARRPANGPAIRIVIISASPVGQGSLRDSAPLRVLAKPSASP